MAPDRFSGTDLDQDAEALVRLVECKINFALGTEPEPGELELVIYLFRKEALFSSLLRGPAPEWYGSAIQDAMAWNEVRTLFITRFSDGRNKIQTQNGSWTMYTRRWRGDSKLPSPNIENSGQRLAWRYGWSRSGWPACWTHRTSSAKKTKIHFLHTKGTSTKIPTTKSSRIFCGTSKCDLERFFNTFNQERCILPSLY